MKVLIISSYIFGYMDYAVEEMKKEGYDVTCFYFDQPPLEFHYKNGLNRGVSFLKKLVGKNIRKDHRYKILKQSLKGKKFDKTLVIHGQYLDAKTHLFLKSITQKYIAFFFDSLTKMPRQKNVIPFFDKIYSYDSVDCEKNNFSFLTNFIPTEKLRSQKFEYTVFNISSLDHRIGLMKKMAKYFNENSISYEFQLCNRELSSLENFRINSERIDVDQVFPMLQKTKVILDISRNDQVGLSFRVFEALGNEKKLITNNKDIINYDFFNANNIWIINEDEIEIPLSFFSTNYQPVAENIYQKYTLKSWIHTLFEE